MDDYLEQILNLIEEKGFARPIDISKRLEISQASVTNMLQRLDTEGLVKHEKYKGTTLTEKGTTIAQAIITRHNTLTEFLRLFNINEETIYRDVEGMEHHVSKDTLQVITTILAELKQNKTLLERLKTSVIANKSNTPTP